MAAEGQWRDLKTASFAFADPGRYHVKLTHSKDGPPGGRLEIASLTDPQGAEAREKLLQDVGK